MSAFHDIASQARLLTLLRLLLLAIGLGTITLFASTHLPLVDGLEGARWLLVGVCLASAALAATTNWVHGRWQLALHLVFDLVWIGLLLFWTGATGSPGVILLFVVVLIGNLVLPGFLRFFLPALAGMVLAVTAAFYVSGRSPFATELTLLTPDLFAPGRVLGNLAVQIGGLFLVDLLGGLLAHRLVESRVFAGGVLDQLGEGVLAIDRYGHVAYANAEAARLLGLEVAPAPGVPVAKALASQELTEVRNLLVAERLPVLERWRGPGGRQLLLRVTELRGRDRSIGRTLIIADETRLRVLENSARRAESLAALGEMAAGIAHEVRNPLTSLRGCAQELAEVAQRSGREDDARLAGVIVSESDRLARIVGDFLELSRMRPPQRSQVEFAPVLQEITTLTMSRPNLPPDLVVLIDVAEECPSVHADPDQLRQVLLNLIANAIEAMHGRPAGRLRLAAAPAGEDNPLDHAAVRLSVTDNGSGISAEHRESVFTPFWSTKPQGTGLGLSLVSRIVREHEGVLRIDSEPGIGSEVVIFLPTISQSRSFKRALGAH